MTSCRTLGALAIAAVAGTAVVALAVDAPAHAATSLSPATVADIDHAAVTEAFAYGQYNAYATAADAAGDPVAAATWRTVADVEYHDHFAKEADLAGRIGTNSENLAAALASEKQARADYTRWIADARAAGCTSVATALEEIRGDEVDHAALLQKAIAAGDDAAVPQGPSSTPVTAKPTTPACAAAAVKADLAEALNSEATAYALYDQWADRAVNTGAPRTAALFRSIGAVELGEHFGTEARLAGLVGGVRSNLRDSIASEKDAIAMYGADAAAATGRGDTAAADLFTEVRGDEQGHLASFQALLAARQA